MKKHNWSRKVKWIFQGGGLVLAISLIYTLLLLSPSLVFAHTYEYEGFKVFSDRAISANIEIVLDDTRHRLQYSELYGGVDDFRIYICNDNWRFTLFTRNASAGGVVNFVLSPNIFIREANIDENEIVPPQTWRHSLADRPLSYFIAHEAVHSLQRGYDPFLVLKYEPEIIEGYADYIAKAPTFDMAKSIQEYKKGASSMKSSSGLYDRYHLFVAYLMECEGFDFLEIVAKKPDLELTLSKLKNLEI
jgi:hypothetical protein